MHPTQYHHYYNKPNITNQISHADKDKMIMTQLTAKIFPQKLPTIYPLKYPFKLNQAQ